MRYLTKTSTKKFSDTIAASIARYVVPAIPQSEVLAKFFEEIGEKCGEILAKFFADFRPSISRENGRKKFHEKSSTFATAHQIKFFHCCNSGGLGAQRYEKYRYWASKVILSCLCVAGDTSASEQAHKGRGLADENRGEPLIVACACIISQQSIREERIGRRP